MAETRHRELLRPYGDRRDDGVVQLSFALPVPPSEKAKEAAIQLVRKLGFQQVLVATMEAASDDFSFFVVYGRTHAAVDFAAIDVPEVVLKKLSFDEVNQQIHEKVGRRIVVVGACTGSDTHAVGIDAIMNMKGYAGDYGLERYPGFEAHNLGSQVENDVLIKKAKEWHADAILVSQVVTQRDLHKDNARQFIDACKAAGVYGKMLLLLGGPRIDHKLALELGFDAGFGPGTKPSDVANYLLARMTQQAAGAGPAGDRAEPAGRSHP
jgi:beta-lysine 5,6-aminomutase beta subunit